MSDVKTISSAEFCQQLAKDESLQVVDVRSPAEFRAEYIETSINVPLDKLSVERLCEQGIDPNKDVYLLCTRGQRSQMAANKLMGAVACHCVTDGLNGLPKSVLIRSEQQVMSLERQVRIAAGALVLTGVVLGSLVSPLAYGLSGFVGAGLMFAGITDTCAMGMLISRMPWNR